MKYSEFEKKIAELGFALEYFICSARQSEWVKTIFTESEIAEMDITGFQKVEVTE